jgi:phosphomannomutase
MGATIKFGTDGWRGIIADQFTFSNLRRVAGKAGQVLYELAERECYEIVVGYDRRFLAREFAQAVAEVLADLGFTVWLADSPAPTPAFSWFAYARQTLGALVITASHNPPQYGGLKIKGSFGGSVGKQVTNLIEQRLEQNQDWQLQRKGAITTFDPWSDYGQQLRSKVDVPAITHLIQTGRLAAYADVMHGTASGGMARLLGLPIPELHSTHDPLFGGIAPEPLAANLGELQQRVSSSSCELAVGFAFDGDSDRLACIDKTGRFLSSQVLIPILLQHLVEHRHRRGLFVKTISGSDLMPRVAGLYGLPVVETPVGFKYIAEQMLAQPTVLGGEESGGIGYGDHIPERDALLSALYLLEAIATSGQNLGQLYAALQDKVNFHFAYDRLDQRLKDMSAQGDVYQKLSRNPPQAIAGIAVTEITNPDGFKFRLANGGWLLVRFSGTEPVLRLYAEAPTQEEVQAILQEISCWLS